MSADNIPKEKMLACPFCGSSRLTMRHFFVECGNCAALGPNGNSESQATEKWNKRHSFEPREHQYVWIVSNRTTQFVFTTESAATKFMSSFPGSVAGGFDVVRAEVLDMDNFIERAQSETLAVPQACPDCPLGPGAPCNEQCERGELK